jgi:putative Mg2+ transporter-C (MgtC) family protein
MNVWEWPVFWDDAARIGMAALLGGLLGFEREWNGHWAGLRTHIMVSLGCAMFVVAGLGIAGEDHREAVTRVIQGIASGVGFLARHRGRGCLPICARCARTGRKIL